MNAVMLLNRAGGCPGFFAGIVYRTEKIINNPKHCHSGFFAISGLDRRTVLYNAKKTGIQIQPAVTNAHLPFLKIQMTRAVPHSRLPKIDSGLFAAWHTLRYTSFLHREKPE